MILSKFRLASTSGGPLLQLQLKKTGSRAFGEKGMGTWAVVGSVGAAAVAGVAILCNLPNNPFVKSPVNATLDWLSDTDLRTFDSEQKTFKEAQGLSSLKAQLDAHGVPLYAVVHESLGVAKFQPYFDGKIFLDKARRFYGPVERTMLWSGLFRWSVISTMLRNRQTGIEGNLKGEGRILGGVFVIGSGDQGILLEHREKEFGYYANTTEVLEAALKVATSKAKKSNL